MAKNLNDPSHAFLEEPAHPLEPFFKPKSVAVIGATTTPKSVGNAVMTNLISGGFSGKIYPVNPKYDTLFDLKCYPSADKIEESVDLAIIIIPAKIVPAIIDQCVAKKIKGAIIISAGFKELGPEGLKLENEVIAKAKAGNLRLVGPNCLGIMNPLINFNGTFAASMALQGSIAFISQSGAMLTSVLDWSLQQKIGFSAFASIGSMVDVSWGDLIDYLGNDPNTKSILIYMETIGDAKKFLSAAREVCINKPIIVIKPGRTEVAARTTESHTGGLAGSDKIFDAAMQRVGVLRVFAISDLFNMAEVLAKQPPPKGPRLTILTNAGGPAVLATDATAYYGAELTEIAPETIEELNKVLPDEWSHGNPVDLLGDAGPERYANALEVVVKDPNTDGILVILSPQEMTDAIGTAEHLKPFAKNSAKPILASWMGGLVMESGVKILNHAHIPTFIYPDDACKTFATMWRQNYALQELYEIPEIRYDEGKPQESVQQTEAIIQKALSENREILTEEESKKILAAYHIPTVQTLVADSPEEAVKAAEEIGYPVALKIHSATITHKSDIGGVLLNLTDKESVKNGFNQIKASAAKIGAEHFLGVTVQKMITQEGYEIILGSSLDPQFGPVILFGTGGRLVEVYQDIAFALPPLNTTLTRRLMEKTKIHQVLEKAIDMTKLEEILISFSELLTKHPHIAECDINPLFASSDQIIALDARIILTKEPLAHPVIRPYPSEYISRCTLNDGAEILLRPVRPEDEPLFMDFHQQLSKETVKARFFEELTYEQRISHERMIQICHTDYDRTLHLVAIQDTGIVGTIRLSKVPLTSSANITLAIIDKMQKKGLGTKLLSTILDIARKESLREVHVQILSDNIAMQKMLERAGFTLSASQKNSKIINAVLEL
ncbi:MAG: Succinyl-CoA ligase [ADP-forming] subunit alpha [Chlamydiae bacterium]|nr:Succinyl-CoA ligase [ADP-forming] subunit alpha [Chlamydiota bacterium]